MKGSYKCKKNLNNNLKKTTWWKQASKQRSVGETPWICKSFSGPSRQEALPPTEMGAMMEMKGLTPTTWNFLSIASCEGILNFHSPRQETRDKRQEKWVSKESKCETHKQAGPGSPTKSCVELHINFSKLRQIPSVGTRSIDSISISNIHLPINRWQHGMVEWL